MIKPHLPLLLLTLPLVGCSYTDEIDMDQYVPEIFKSNTLIYRPLIQQGNIVRQEKLNKIRPGMSKRQVQFILGSPMLKDMFHENRWDYAFTLTRGSKRLEEQHIILIFEDDQLVSVSGDKKPGDKVEESTSKEAVYDVPDWTPPNPGIFERLKGSVGLSDDE